MSFDPVQFSVMSGHPHRNSSGSWKSKPETQVDVQGWAHLCGVGMKKMGRLTEEISIMRYEQTEDRRT